jgi:hypothetical protein
MVRLTKKEQFELFKVHTIQYRDKQCEYCDFTMMDDGCPDCGAGADGYWVTTQTDVYREDLEDYDDYKIIESTVLDRNKLSEMIENNKLSKAKLKYFNELLNNKIYK